MLETLQARIGQNEFWAMKPVLLAPGAAGVRARPGWPRFRKWSPPLATRRNNRERSCQPIFINASERDRTGSPRWRQQCVQGLAGCWLPRAAPHWIQAG